MTAALVAGGVLHAAEKAAPEPKDPQTAEESPSEPGSSGIASSVINGKGTVKYLGKEVWKGTVKDQLSALRESV